MPVLTVNTQPPYPPKHVTLARMHIGFGKVMKLITILIHNPAKPDEEGNPSVEGEAVIDEDAFKSLLAGTFPHKELDGLKAPTESSSDPSLPDALPAHAIRSNFEHMAKTTLLPAFKGKRVTVKPGVLFNHNKTTPTTGTIHDIVFADTGNPLLQLVVDEVPYTTTGEKPTVQFNEIE